MMELLKHAYSHGLSSKLDENDDEDEYIQKKTWILDDDTICKGRNQ